MFTLLCCAMLLLLGTEAIDPNEDFGTPCSFDSECSDPNSYCNVNFDYGSGRGMCFNRDLTYHVPGPFCSFDTECPLRTTCELIPGSKFKMCATMRATKLSTWHVLRLCRQHHDCDLDDDDDRFSCGPILGTSEKACLPYYKSNAALFNCKDCRQRPLR